MYTLSINDFKTKYIGYYLGLVWAVVQPIITILIYWIVCQYGLKAGQDMKFPYILWFMAGIIPWFFFNEAFLSATGAFVQYGFLVKKMIFKIELLPLVKIISSFVMNIVFNLILLIAYAFAGKLMIIHIVDIIYYNICLLALLTGLAYLFSTLNVFIRDTARIVEIILQFGFWITPIMWQIEIAGKYAWIFKLNPLYYITNGYREALIKGNWFFQNIKEGIVFWIITLIFILLGSLTFHKLKDHLADTL